MCGIAGFVGALAEDRAQNAIAAMLSAQAHRGPDDFSQTLIRADTSVVAFGSRRLAVIDLSPLGRQPMTNPDTGDILVFNGEIYNSTEIRQALASSGFRFRGRSDTESILRAYEHWGFSFLDHLRGMFSVAIWDARQQRLLLARDPFGIKPLYYAEGIPGCLFASEVRAMGASGLVDRRIDQQALTAYLAFGAVQDPLTILRGVFSVPPGGWITVTRSGEVERTGKHWTFPPPDERNHQRPMEDLAAEGRHLLERSVASHLESDRPVGVFLSSGLDSTAVLGLAKKATADVRAFTVGFPDDPAGDEAPSAARVARRMGVEHRHCPIRETTALEWIEQGIVCIDQPAMDGLNTYMVSRAARDAGIVVALSGQGADELFGGYPTFRQVPVWAKRAARFDRLPGVMREAWNAIRTFGMSPAGKARYRDLASCEPDLRSAYRHVRQILPDAWLTALGCDPRLLQLPDSTDLDLAGDDVVAGVCRLESAHYLVNTLLRDADVYGMANSIEIRLPFLDRDLAEWALRLPGDRLMPSSEPRKCLVRMMCADLFDPLQLRLPKRGFTLPFGAWIHGPLRGLVDAALDSLRVSGAVDPRGIDEVRAACGRSTHWTPLWTLAVLGFWMGRHRSRNQAATASG